MTKKDIKEVFAELRKFDTPTVCNAIEIVKGQRQSSGFTAHPMVAMDPRLPPMVGFAKTATIAARQPSTLSEEELLSIRFRYYDSLVTEPLPAIAVLADKDWPQPLGAMVGEVTVATHKGLKVEGLITSGLMRDLDQVDKGFQVLAAAVGPSHAFVHFQEAGVPVSILDMQVESDDIIHADRHGAVIITKEVLPELLAAIATVIKKEKIVLEPARADDFNIDKLKTAWRAFVRSD